MDFKFSTKYLTNGRRDIEKGEGCCEAIKEGHTSQHGTIWKDDDYTTGYVTMALQYVMDETNNTEVLIALVIQADRDYNWSIEEEWIPVEQLQKRPMTVREFEDIINPGHWIERINSIWRKNDSE